MKKFFKFCKISIFAILFLSIIAILGISYAAFKRLVYPKDLILKTGELQSVKAKTLKTEIFKKHPNIKEITFKTEDDINLKGLWLKRDNACANILICHGYQSSKEFVADYIEIFPRYNVLLFDFRGHGESEGKYRTLGCTEYKDVLAAIKTINSLNTQLPNIILGVSMGGAAALNALTQKPDICKVMILDSSFGNLSNVIYNTFARKAGLPNYPFLYFLEKATNTFADCNIEEMKLAPKLKSIDTPIFFIHSCVDKIVPPQESLTLYANSNSTKKKLWIAPKCKHCHLRIKHTETYKHKIYKFLRANSLMA